MSRFRRGVLRVAVAVVGAVSCSPSPASACSVQLTLVEELELRLAHTLCDGAPCPPPGWLHARPWLSPFAGELRFHHAQLNINGFVDNCSPSYEPYAFDVQFALKEATPPGPSAACFFDEVANPELLRRQGFSTRPHLVRPGVYGLVRQHGERNLPLPPGTTLSIGAERRWARLRFRSERGEIVAHFETVATSVDPALTALCPDPQPTAPEVIPGGCRACQQAATGGHVGGAWPWFLMALLLRWRRDPKVARLRQLGGLRQEGTERRGEHTEASVRGCGRRR